MEQKIDKAIQAAGGQRALARLLNCSPSLVHKMSKTGHVPAQRCRAIEAAVNGVVTAEELRPDIFVPVKAA